MNELFTPENLKNAGLALALLVSIGVNYKLVIAFNKTLSNHINHNTESNTNLKNAIDKLIRFLEKRLKI